jgi:hypothetical protein
MISIAYSRACSFTGSPELVARLTSKSSMAMKVSVSFVDFVDGADGGVIQRRSCPGFPPKTLESLGIAGEVFRQELQPNPSAELEVFRLVHCAHAAAAELPENPVVRQGIANQMVGRVHCRNIIGGCAHWSIQNG